MILLSCCWLMYAVSCVYLKWCASESFARPRSGDICLLNLILVSVFVLASLVSRVLQDMWDCGVSRGMECVDAEVHQNLSESFRWLSQLCYSWKCWKCCIYALQCSSCQAERPAGSFFHVYCFMYYSFHFLMLCHSVMLSVSAHCISHQNYEIGP